MLSRHFLRAKVLQTVYAQLSAGESHTGKARRSFDHNIDRLNELGVLQLASIQQVINAGRQVIEDGLKKHLPSKEDLNPTYLIVDNPFIQVLSENFDYNSHCDKYTFNWSLYDDVMRRIYTSFRSGNKFKEYLALETRTSEDDHRMVLNLFKHIINMPDYREIFSDRSLLWDDDFDQVAQYNFAMLKAIDPDLFDASTQLRLMMDERDEGDMEALRFSHTLLTESLSHVPETEEMIRKHLKNWDFDRVALMDIIILNMGVAELTACPSIPERVTVDECIELSKEFSSDKSKIFVNGILDKMILELRLQGRINKTGRGLFIPDPDASDEGSTDVAHF